jgi:hypothetical protein
VLSGREGVNATAGTFEPGAGAGRNPYAGRASPAARALEAEAPDTIHAQRTMIWASSLEQQLRRPRRAVGRHGPVVQAVVAVAIITLGVLTFAQPESWRLAAWVAIATGAAFLVRAALSPAAPRGIDRLAGGAGMAFGALAFLTVEVQFVLAAAVIASGAGLLVRARRTWGRDKHSWLIEAVPVGLLGLGVIVLGVFAFIGLTQPLPVGGIAAVAVGVDLTVRATR